ncbi:UNVERIFIED_CONTAM: hypothetical protein FKN15_034906 [Acipenser sinensis]
MKAVFVVLYLSLSLAVLLVDATLSKTDAKKATAKNQEKETQLSDRLAQDRGLVITDPKAKDIVREHGRYCGDKVRERQLSGAVLGYITPWNSHGYDVAKVFGPKFTAVSPVWLQIRRRGPESFHVTGLHDVDQGWIKAVRKSSKHIQIVPRLLFDGWTLQDFESVFESEDEIEELGKEVVEGAKADRFDGFVLEVWSQLGGQKRKELVHLVTHLCEALRSARLVCILVIPPAIAPGELVHLVTHLCEALRSARLVCILVIPPAIAPGSNQPGMFGKSEFDQLAHIVDGFSLMTYDFSSPGRPGPSSPVPWVRSCVQLLDPQSQWRSKILLGLNFYGMDFSAAGGGMEPVLGRRYSMHRSGGTPCPFKQAECIPGTWPQRQRDSHPKVFCQSSLYLLYVLEIYED